MAKFDSSEWAGTWNLDPLICLAAFYLIWISELFSIIAAIAILAETSFRQLQLRNSYLFFLDFFKDATVNGGAVVGFRGRHGGVDMAETVTEFQADGGSAGVLISHGQPTFLHGLLHGCHYVAARVAQRAVEIEDNQFDWHEDDGSFGGEVG